MILGDVSYDHGRWERGHESSRRASSGSAGLTSQLTSNSERDIKLKLRWRDTTCECEMELGMFRRVEDGCLDGLLLGEDGKEEERWMVSMVL